MKTTISIIVPCFNQAQYLDEALQSVLEQTYINWECIIVNDGSPDNTEEIAKKWTEKDKRFKYLYQDNGGLSSARNFGINNANGEYILPLDADDKIAVNYVLLALQEFDNDANLKLVYCRAEKFGDETGEWVLEKYSTTALARRNMIFCSAIYKKIDWINAKGYDVNLIYGLEDWDLWIAILKTGGNVKCIDYIGFFYRIRQGSMARAIDIKQIKFSENYIYLKHLDFLIDNYDYLEQNNKKLLTENIILKANLKSEKVLINELCIRTFGFRIFKLKRNS